MPNTRSKGQAQPTLQYPRRKSTRAGCNVKSSPPPEEQPPVELKTRIQDRLLIGPLSPRTSTNKAMAPFRLGPLSPRKANPLSTCLTTRLPLSPRKRTGDENGCNLSANLMGSPPKQSRPTLLGSPRKLMLDENSMNRPTLLGSPRKLVLDENSMNRPTFLGSPRKLVLDENSMNRPTLLGSPRKLVLDENSMNRPTLLGSPRKLVLDENSMNRPTLLGSPRKLVLDENSMNFTAISSSHRGGLGSPKQPLTPPSRALLSRLQEVPSGSLTCQSPEKKPPVKSLFSERSKYQGVKQALHTAIPERLLSREAERASIRTFLEQQVLKALPSSLYISGAPGTGKTACLNCVLQEMKDELKPVKTVVVNCMTLRSSHAIFPLLADRLGAPGSHTDSKLQKLLTSSGPPVLLVLDEMDQLDSKAQDVLYTIFEWPYLPKSRLCLIGIANALDLTDRILPRLQALPRCRPQLLNFPPYSRQELTAIVQDRLTQVSGEGMLDAAAVQFCARKVSAVSGDARKALDICRRAVEMVEADGRKKAATATADGKVMRVSVPQVARVLSDVYGDRMSSTGGGEGESLPLQQKLLVCCLLLLTRTGKSKEVPLGKLHEVFSRLCTKRQVGGLGQGECLSLCGLLESRGIFALKKSKETRLTKVFLKIEEKDVENALKDRALLGSILEAGLP